MSACEGTCAKLAAGGVTTREAEVCPPEAETLRTIGKSWESSTLRRCPECGAFYRYRHHYEYNAVGPSWDEYYLWRLEDPAQELLRTLVDATPPEGRDAGLAAALAHENTHARDGSALLGWVWAEEGLAIEQAIAPACRALDGPSLWAPLFCWQILRITLERGREPATKVLAALQANPGTRPLGKDKVQSLMRQCRKHTG